MSAFDHSCILLTLSENVLLFKLHTLHFYFNNKAVFSLGLDINTNLCNVIYRNETYKLAFFLHNAFVPAAI